MLANYRRCLACRHVAPKQFFWRIVRVHPSRQVQLERGMGRSAYLCPRESCLKIASHKKRLERSLKAAIPPAIYQTLWDRLTETRQPGITLQP